MKIESLNNPRVKEWCKLKEKKYRDQEGLFLIEGEHLIQEASKKGIVKEILSTSEELEADFYITETIMKKISSQVSLPKRIAVCEKLKEEKLKNRVLVLDGIQDPGNLGTMIRSAVAFGFTDILLSLDTVDLYNEKVIRASEGMLFHINIVKGDLKPFLDGMKGIYQILATDVKSGENITQIPKEENRALLIGNEGQGLKEEVKVYATHFIKIPMHQSCESLNAGVAAGILMYEMRDLDA